MLQKVVILMYFDNTLYVYSSYYLLYVLKISLIYLYEIF